MDGKSSSRDSNAVRAGLREQQQQNTALLLDIGTEPGMLHKERQRLMALVSRVEGLIEHMFALDDAAGALHSSATYAKFDHLGPEITALAKHTAEALIYLKSKLIHSAETQPPDLLRGIFQMDSRFAQLSEQGLLLHFEPSELLHLCSFLFNLRMARETAEMLEIARANTPTDKGADSQKRRELDQAYRNTTYEIDGPDGKMCLRIDGSAHPLEPLLKKHGKRTWAFVSAHNPRSEPRRAEENVKYHERLEADVRIAGYQAYRGAVSATTKVGRPRRAS